MLTLFACLYMTQTRKKIHNLSRFKAHLLCVLPDCYRLWQHFQELLNQVKLNVFVNFLCGSTDMPLLRENIVKQIFTSYNNFFFLHIFLPDT